jgi:hypothetical protein
MTAALNPLTLTLSPEGRGECAHLAMLFFPSPLGGEGQGEGAAAHATPKGMLP